MTKSPIRPVCPAKSQIKLGICSVCSETSLCPHLVANDPGLFLKERKTAGLRSEAQSDGECYASDPCN